VSLICGIIVTYNPELTFFKKQIEILSQQIDTLIIIDNASELQSKLKELAYISDRSIIFEPLEDNFGLSFAQNRGIDKAYDLNASHVVLFDQDSLIDDGFIDGLLEAEAVMLAAGKKVGAVGPLFYDPGNKVIYPATVYTGPFLKRVSMSKNNTEIEATFIISSGSLIRLDIMKAIGPMNEELFIDYIDVEWSLRAKKLGYCVYMTSRAKMAHTIGENRSNIFGRTILVHSPLRRYYLIRNSFYMLRQDYIPIGYKLRELVFNLVRVLVGFILIKERSKFAYYIVLGIKDGIMGNFGKCRYK
jgi:rhamnosyltransferase